VYNYNFKDNLLIISRINWLSVYNLWTGAILGTKLGLH